MRECDLRSSVASAVQEAKHQIDEKYGDSPVFGFALCTDDEVRTLYHVACTTDWVSQRVQGYPKIGFMYVEWMQSGDDSLFGEISAILDQLADQEYGSDEAWETARDDRFEALVLGLYDVRKAGHFDRDTLLCVGSTDPSEHLEALAVDGVYQLNTMAVADKFADAFGYEVCRNSVKDRIQRIFKNIPFFSKD